MPKVLIVSDHAGFKLKSKIIQNLKNIEWVDLNPELEEQDDYPEKAFLLAQQLKAQNLLAVAICGSGQGICMALNRFAWIRAGIGYDTASAKIIRNDNNANVICLNGRSLEIKDAQEVINTFIKSEFETEERFIRRIAQIS